MNDEYVIVEFEYRDVIARKEYSYECKQDLYYLTGDCNGYNFSYFRNERPLNICETQCSNRVNK